LLIGWPAAALFSAAWLRRQAAKERTDPVEAGEATFEEAQEHYLKGNWFEAERVLGILLRRNTRDLEARLMLATLYRHTRRFDEAARQLDSLGRCEGAEKWEWEICRERELLAEARTEGDSPVFADTKTGTVPTEAEPAQDDAAPQVEAAPDRTTPPDEMMHAA
jgi:thioredoxin-like negative regulator of GroEL